MQVGVLLSRYLAYVKCPSCEGGRYQPEALNYKIVTAVCDRGNQTNRAPSAPPQLTLPQLAAPPISAALDILADIEVAPADSAAATLFDEIFARPRYLCERRLL